MAASYHIRTVLEVAKLTKSYIATYFFRRFRCFWPFFKDFDESKQESLVAE